MLLNTETRREIDSKVRSLSYGELLERFHCLVDKRLEKSLPFIEGLELERIEARLDEHDEANLVTRFQISWATERSALLASIEQLVAALKTEQCS